METGVWRLLARTDCDRPWRQLVWETFEGQSRAGKAVVEAVPD